MACVFYTCLMFSNACLVLSQCNVHVQTIFILPPEGIGISWGWGFWKTQKSKEMNEALFLYTVIKCCHVTLYPSQRAAQDTHNLFFTNTCIRTHLYCDTCIHDTWVPSKVNRILLSRVSVLLQFTNRFHVATCLFSNK